MATIEEFVSDLRDKVDYSFTCTSKGENVKVTGGKSVTRKESGSPKKYEQFFIEPRCSHYSGDFYGVGTVSMSGGRCDLGGYCPYTTTKGFNPTGRNHHDFLPS